MLQCSLLFQNEGNASAVSCPNTQQSTEDIFDEEIPRDFSSVTPCDVARFSSQTTSEMATFFVANFLGPDDLDGSGIEFAAPEPGNPSKGEQVTIFMLPIQKLIKKIPRRAQSHAMSHNFDHNLTPTSFVQAFGTSLNGNTYGTKY